MYLLDTCAFLWALDDSADLSVKARSIIQDGKDVFLSQVSLWEIAIKKSIGKLDLKETTNELEQYCADAGIGILPIENSYFDTIQKLPFHHNDPFDRLIIATAAEKNFSVLTTDRSFSQYSEVTVIW